MRRPHLLALSACFALGAGACLKAGPPQLDAFDPGAPSDLAAGPGDARPGADLAAPDLRTRPRAWSKVPTSGGPPPLNAYGIAYDSARRRVVLFGGFEQPMAGERAITNRTWEWDGALWLERMPRQRPPARCHFAMAFDEKRGKTVLFGGASGPGPDVDRNVNDTWVWDGENWTQLSVSAPSPRESTRMVYDRRRDRMVLFGGNTLGGVNKLDETWEFFGGSMDYAGATWAQRETAPAPRSHAGLAYDGERTVLFGGANNGSDHTDTWSWDGDRWERLMPAQRPSGTDLALAPDPDAPGRLVLLQNPNLTPAATETWLFDGRTWQRDEAQGPSPPRFYQQLVPMQDRDGAHLLTFGGRHRGDPDDYSLADTWVYR